MFKVNTIEDLRPGYTTTEVESCGSTWILTTNPGGSSMYCEKPHWGQVCALSFKDVHITPRNLHEIVVNISAQYNRGKRDGIAESQQEIRRALGL